MQECAAVCFSLRPNMQRLKYTALHAAADSGHLNVVQLLVESGASVNVQRTVSTQFLLAAMSPPLSPSAVWRLFDSRPPTPHVLPCHGGSFCWTHHFILRRLGAMRRW